MGGDIIGLTVLAIAAQLTQVLAVVGTDDDDRILVDALLSNDAVTAKEIIANYKPQYPSIKAYLDAIDALTLDKDAVKYDENGNVTVDFQN